MLIADGSGGGLPSTYARRTAARYASRTAWMTSTRRRPSETSPRSWATAASREIVSDLRAMRTSGWPRSRRVSSLMRLKRCEGGRSLSGETGGIFSLRIALKRLSSMAWRYAAYSTAFRSSWASCLPGPSKSSYSHSGHSSISATSKTSRMRIATASVRWFVRCRLTRTRSLSLVCPT
jgi:hypothetical protein